MSQTEIKKIRKTGLIAPVILSVIGTLHLWRGHSKVSIALYTLALIIFIMTMFFPAAFKKTTNAIGTFITNIMLSIVFFLVITPFGLIMRLFRKDPLDKKIEKDKDSYWIKREEASEDVSSYEKQF